MENPFSKINGDLRKIPPRHLKANQIPVGFFQQRKGLGGTPIQVFFLGSHFPNRIA
jgi:hypothetical protein